MPARIFLPLVLLVAAGCFPIELDVSERGELLIYRQEGFFVFDPATKKTQPIIGPGADKPVFARFVPEKKEILTVLDCSVDQNGMSWERKHRFEVIALSGESKRTIHNDANCCYAVFSRNGRYLAVSRMADRTTITKDGVTEAHKSWQAPELVLIDMEKSTTKRFSELNIHPFVRWFNDSQRVLALIAPEPGDGKTVVGQLCSIDVANGKVNKLVSVASNTGIDFALSPDNHKVLIAADAVGIPTANLQANPKGDGYFPVHEFDTKSGELRLLDFRSRFAIYSPNGKKVLVCQKKESGGDLLVVVEADGSTGKIIADDYCFNPPAASIGEGVAMIPSWIGNESIAYAAARSVFGTSAQAPWLKVLKIDGPEYSVLQPYLDIAALESEKTIRNPRRVPLAPKRPLPFPMILGN